MLLPDLSKLAICHPTTIGVPPRKQKSRPPPVKPTINKKLSVEERSVVAKYMPSLEELRNAVRATHKICMYAKKHKDVSAAWSMNNGAEHVDADSYNHFWAIDFINNNERMIILASRLIVPFYDNFRNNTMTLEQSAFVDNLREASTMLARIIELNTEAPMWRKMRQYAMYATNI
jgi:hypothetical protein